MLGYDLGQCAELRESFAGYLSIRVFISPSVSVTLNDPGVDTYDLKGGVGAYSVTATDFEILYKTLAARDPNRSLTFYWMAIGLK